jgi:SAM-dependent methyltransferase
MDNGWESSASAWIADMGEHGDFGRQHVLDAPMLARVRGRGFRHAVDIGCGEGRFCRMLRPLGITTIGIDPTPDLLATATARDPDGDYRIGHGEALDLPDAAFDLVISYLSLIDIADLDAAIAEMVRVLAPGGTLLIANLNGFKTAQSGGLGQDYGDEWASWEEWRGIRVQNWHRPLSRYIALLLGQGLVLRHFDEPNPTGGEPAKAARYRRWPWYLIMEWQKPEVSRPAPP